MIFDIVQDFGAVLDAMPLEHPKRRMLKLLDEAIRRDIQFIARHPTTLFQCLWNLCWWHENPVAERHYQGNESTRKVEPLLAKTTVSMLSELLDKWHRLKDSDRFNFIWVRSLRPPVQPLDSSLMTTFRGHENPVWSVCYSPNGELLASVAAGYNQKEQGTGVNSAIRVYETSGGVPLTTMTVAGEFINNVLFLGEGQRILSVGHETIRGWNARTGEQLFLYRAPQRGVASARICPEGKVMILGGYDAAIRIWDLENGTELALLSGHTGPVHALAVSCDGRYLVSGSADKSVRLWDLNSKELLKVFIGHDAKVNAVGLSPDSNVIVSGSGDNQYLGDNVRDNSIRLWSVSGGNQLAVLGVADEPVNSIDFAPDGQTVVSGEGSLLCGKNGVIRIWDARSRRVLAWLEGHEDAVHSVRFSPDGRTVASGSGGTNGMDYTLRIWDTGVRPRDLRLAGHSDEIRIMTFSPNGRRIVTTSWDEPPLIWDSRTGEIVATLRGHEALVRCVAFSPNGKQVATGGGSKYSDRDCTVRLWDVETGRLLKILRGHENPITVIRFSVNGRYLMSGETYQSSLVPKVGGVRVWNTLDGDLLAEVRGDLLGITEVDYGECKKMLERWGFQLQNTTNPSSGKFEVVSQPTEIAIERGKRKVAWVNESTKLPPAIHPKEPIFACGIGRQFALFSIEGFKG